MRYVTTDSCPLNEAKSTALYPFVFSSLTFIKSVLTNTSAKYYTVFRSPLDAASIKTLDPF